jgi:hypothetical protein
LPSALVQHIFRQDRRGVQIEQNVATGTGRTRLT